MKPLPNTGSTGFTLSGFLILAALGAFIWKGAPLDSVRPSNEQSGWYDSRQAQQVPARLWQDPFKAAYNHKQDIKSGKKNPSLEGTLKSNISKVHQKGDITFLMILVSPGSYAVQEERRRRRRYAVLSALGEENYIPKNSDMLNVFYQPNSRSSEKNSCFSLLTGASQDKESSEDKIPSDDKVSSEDKILSDDKVSSEDKKPSIPKTDNNGQTFLENHYSIPYEWHYYENFSNNTNEQHQVLVLWLDESQFVDSPLNCVTQLLDKLLPKDKQKLEHNINATLIGPARSDTLRNLVTKDESFAYQFLCCDPRLSVFNIFSATATVDDKNLINDKNLSDSPLSKLKNKIEKYGDNKHRPSLNFLRTIQSDDILINKLAKELILKRMISPEEDRVVVISEMDTYFGRSLPRAFEEYFCGNGNRDKNGCNNHLVRYNYQRGMDGIIAGEKGSPTSSVSSKSEKKNGLSQSIGSAAMRRPVGPGQFDYLRRLATEIKQKDREWRLESGHGVRAVILLGSDVYDKLLILRALRPELPGAVFATTDLDAQLMHPAEHSWTRNVIVASTYDLSLSSKITMTTMPFRDSYQTSVYLATRLNFNKELQKEVMLDQDKMNERIPAQLLEIGRQSLVQLPDNKEIENTWNLLSVKPFALAVFSGLICMVVLGIFSLHQLKPRAGRIVVVLVIMLIVFIAFFVLISVKNTGGEPLTLLAGASIWPAEYIRLFGVILSLVFIWSVINRLHKNWVDLGYRYFRQGSKIDDYSLTLTEILNALKVKLLHPVQNLKKINSAQFFSALMMVSLFIIMAKILPIKWALMDKIGLLIEVWLCLILFWWWLIYGYICKDFKVLSINKWGNNCAPDNEDAVKMWYKYGEYGAADHRFLRTIAYILIYFAFASFLFAILGAPESPCRGEFACKIDKIILGFSVLSMLALLFLVVDAARLCICWVDLMRNNKIDWSKTRIKEFVQRLKLPETHAEAWMKVYLIGERTNEVTRLIYYPVLIILLLLLARSTYFDNWDFPQALAIVIGLNFIIALGSVVRLNFMAQSVRNEILRKLQDENLADDREEKEKYEPSSLERNELIQQLENLRIGAYLRIWDQPPVRATLMLLGGVALTFAEYVRVLF